MIWYDILWYDILWYDILWHRTDVILCKYWYSKFDRNFTFQCQFDPCTSLFFHIYPHISLLYLTHFMYFVYYVTSLILFCDKPLARLVFRLIIFLSSFALNCYGQYVLYTVCDYVLFTGCDGQYVLHMQRTVPTGSLVDWSLLPPLIQLRWEFRKTVSTAV